MKDTMATTMSRRGWLSRLLLAAAVAPVAGVRLADPVAADKKKTKKQRVDAYKRTCELNGGTATIESRPGGTTVTCTGGKDPATGAPQDWTCTVHSKGSRCHANLTNSPSSPLNDTTAPPTGGAEQPTSGANPGGGGAVDPPGTADPDLSDGGGVVLTAYDDENHDNAKHDGKRKNRGRDGKRGRD